MAQQSNMLPGGRWQVLHQVNSGGQGRVCAVTDTTTSEKYAAKIFKVKGYERQKLARAKVEIEAIKKLKGSVNVVQIVDENISIAEPGKQVELFYVMGYAKHGSLADNDFYIGDVEQCLRIFKEILLGVREAHRKGVIHRDLKPANILLYPTQRQIVVTDFGVGLIKDRESDKQITQPNELVGPRFFIAPEQWVNPSKADERSDIYSLGKILYYMLTGKGKVFREQLDDINADLKNPNPYIPQVQDLLLNRMVAEKSADRFVKVDEAIDSVERILSQMEANSQRYLNPTGHSEDLLSSMVVSNRELLYSWFKRDVPLALRALEETLKTLRGDAKHNTLKSLEEDLVGQFPNGKVNAAIKSVVAYVVDPQQLSSMQSKSRYSFPSYYMAKYYIQSLALGTAHSYIIKAIEMEKDASLRLLYLLTFEEVSRRCNCSQPHDYDQRMLTLLRGEESKREYLIRVLGQHYLKLGQKRKGLRFLEAFLDTQPYEHSIRFDCAYAYGELGEANLAIHHYTILADDPQYIARKDSALNNLAVAYDALVMPSMAMSNYRDAYEIGSTIAGANVAGRYIQIGMFDEAKELLDDIITKYPKTYHENVATHLGDIVKKRREEAEKLKELEESAALLKHHSVLAVRAFVNEDQLSWLGQWQFDVYKFECLEIDGNIFVRALEPKMGATVANFKGVVDDNCIEISALGKPFEQFSRSGMLYLTSRTEFAGYLISSDEKFQAVTGIRL